jgi:serine protease AprX
VRLIEAEEVFMANDVDVLIEVIQETPSPFEVHAAAVESRAAMESLTAQALSKVGMDGITVNADIAPIPMLLHPADPQNRNIDVLRQLDALRPSLEARGAAPQFSGRSTVIAARVEEGRLKELKTQPHVVIWPNSALTLLGPVDCRPFQPGVDIATLRATLGVDAAFNDGFRGKDIVVGIIDEGVNGTAYSVQGGFSRPGSAAQPGSAQVTSHGSMCAADVLIAAPEARIFDYPFLGIQNSGGALQMFQAVLDQRRRDGTPHITNNSWGFTGIPDQAVFPNHEIFDINHPLHRKIREVIAAGVICFFAAGNCGQECPSGNCDASGIGPGKSIHASNSLAEVITVAAVNNARDRIGYSSQGPGMFEPNKPDVASYSHVFANFGPGRPGGLAQPFDNGTSAATPVAAGVAAMLLSAFPALTPAKLKSVLIQTAIGAGAGWNRDFGNGIIDARNAYQSLKASA